MKKINKISFFLSLFFILFSSCSLIEKEGIAIGLKNTSDILLKDYPVYIDLNELQAKHPEINPDSIIISYKKQEIPFQILEKTGGQKLLILVDLLPNEQESIVVKKGVSEKQWKKRTSAEISVKTGGEFIDKKYVGGDGIFVSIDSLRVPDDYTDHSYYIKYEGPGWESDKVAYRLYLDWRNAIDIFGKITNEVTLPIVGANGYDSYHNMADWGMDILKVGNSLGMGSIGTWNGKNAERVAKTDSVNCIIHTNGDLYSSFITNYYNWQSNTGKVDLKVNTSIVAGSRMTKQKLEFNGDIKNITTGIVKHNDLPMIKGPADTEWGYIATWGLQSLNNDSLGMAVFFKNDDVIEITEDDLSYVVVLNPGDENKVKYYFAAMWDKENNQSFSNEDFKTYLENSIVFLSKPVNVELK